MKAHIIENVDVETIELVLNKKKYEVACSLKVLKKINRMPDDIDQIDSIIKIVTWLINDSIEREYQLTGEQGNKVDEDYVSLFITNKNLEYFYNILTETMGISLPSAEPSKDDEGDTVVVTDEMREMFGEEPKNTETE